MPDQHDDAGEPHIDAGVLMRQLAQGCDREAAQDCGACTASRRRTCEDALAEPLDDAFALFFEHFSREEAVMKSLPRTAETWERCERHRSDHADIAARLSALAGRLHGGDVLVCRTELRALVQYWLQVHTRDHDEDLKRGIGAGAIRPAAP